MKNIREKLHSPWLEALLAFLSAVLGLFAGKLIEAIVPPLFQPSNLPYIAFCLISVMFLADVIYSVTLWRSARQHIAEVADHTNDLAVAVGHRVKTVSYSQGYKELEKTIRAAKKEILILTEYANIFDWEGGKQIWDPERLNSPQRESFYTTLQKKLNRERGKGKLRFVQIVQIPEQHRIEEMLPYDTLYAKNCKFIVNIAQAEPEFASLRVCGMIFSNSIILIDESFAHISFDVRKPDESEVDAPFVMLIEDPNSEAIKNLLKLYRRVEASSTLVTRIEQISPHT
jgi:hypothetical protein